MMAIRVRQALLDDVSAVTAIYCSLVPTWEKTLADGERISADYDDLNIYERWQYGGAWLSLETCAIWLGHLLQSQDTIPLVAEIDGEIVGYAECFIGNEAPPYGLHINISAMCVVEHAQRQGVGRELVRYIEQMANVLGCERVTAAYPDPLEFWQAQGFEPFTTRQMLITPAEDGRVFYKAHPLETFDPSQVAGWHMGLGRFQNAREEWERMHWNIWNGVPQLVEAAWHRLEINLTGQPCIIQLHQNANDRGLVTARAWTKHPLSTHIVSVVRDRAARLGYERVLLMMDEGDRGLAKNGDPFSGPSDLFAKSI